MYFAFKDQNLEEIVSKLKNIEYSWLLLSMSFGAIAIVSRGVRWIYLIKALGYNSSVKNSVNSVAVGYLTNILIPRAGEVSRCTSLQQVEKIPFNKLFGTIILERVIDFAILISLILVSFLYKYQEINSFFSEILGSSNESLLTNPILFYLITFSIILYLLRNQIKKLKYYEKIKSLVSGVK